MRSLSELRHRGGELLRAVDMAADVAAGSDFRAIHVRAVHGTWGVALGFALDPADNDHAVAVGPGFGYDCRGREIATAEHALVPIPSVDDAADLVISADCGVRLDWRRPGHACEDELVLARADFQDGRVVELDESVRRWCRSRRFRLGGGVVEKPVAAKLTIPTAAASFRVTPFYFATLESDLEAAATLDIDNETSTRFRLSFRAPPAQISAAIAKKLKVCVHWVGVEPLPQCGLDPEEDS